MTRPLVFAYGSNMHPERMLVRVPGATARGAGRLRGQRVVLNKRGADGSAKANLAADPEGVVWGVLWEVDPADRETLDRFEGGYERVRVTVEAGDGCLEAETYVSQRLADGALPYDWYLEHIVRGARAFGFPEAYVAHLAAHPCEPDPTRAPAANEEPT